MKFYLIENEGGETLGCELTKKAAYARAESKGYTKIEVCLYCMDIDVNAENMRRILSGEGGYAN
jgi:hypothetical protein